jgi:hypothetical protein
MFDPNVLFEFFYETKGMLSFEDIEKKFPNPSAQKLLDSVNYLVNQNLLEEDGKGWKVSPYGIKKYESLLEKERLKEQRTSKEYEQLHLGVDDLVNRLSDYNKVKHWAKWSVILAGLSAVIALIALLK